MLTKEQLERMRDADISKAGRGALKNVEKITIDTTLPLAQRMEQYLAQVNNPYCFLCDDLPVKVRFVSEDRRLENALEQYCIRLKT